MLDIYQAMVDRNALHAVLPLLAPDSKLEAQRMIGKLDAAITHAQALEEVLPWIS